MSTKVAFACLKAAGTFRDLARRYAIMATAFPDHAERDLAEAKRLKAEARWHIARARNSDGPRLPA